MINRTPLAAANWKMAMTLDQCRSFAREFEQEMGGLMGKMQVILWMIHYVLEYLVSVMIHHGFSSRHTEVF